jgi:hypothetical protein
MRALELWISEYLLNSLWQVPLLFVAAWVAARMIRSTGAGSAHRIWVGALVLEAVLPGFRVDLSRVDLFRMLRGVKSFLPWSWGGEVGGGHTHIAFGAGTGSALGCCGFRRSYWRGLWRSIWAACFIFRGGWRGECGGRF